MTGADSIHASFSKTHELSLMILGVLEQENVPVGYGALACALSLGRLLRPTERLSDDEEVLFVQDAMAFAGSYWGDGKGKVS